MNSGHRGRGAAGNPHESVPDCDGVERAPVDRLDDLPRLRIDLQESRGAGRDPDGAFADRNSRLSRRVAGCKPFRRPGKRGRLPRPRRIPVDPDETTAVPVHHPRSLEVRRECARPHPRRRHVLRPATDAIERADGRSAVACHPDGPPPPPPRAKADPEVGPRLRADPRRRRRRRPRSRLSPPDPGSRRGLGQGRRRGSRPPRRRHRPASARGEHSVGGRTGRRRPPYGPRPPVPRLHRRGAHPPRRLGRPTEAGSPPTTPEQRAERCAPGFRCPSAGASRGRRARCRAAPRPV